MEVSPTEGKTGRQLETKHFWHRSKNYRVGFGGFVFCFFSPRPAIILTEKKRG